MRHYDSYSEKVAYSSKFMYEVVKIPKIVKKVVKDGKKITFAKHTIIIYQKKKSYIIDPDQQSGHWTLFVWKKNVNPDINTTFT